MTTRELLKEFLADLSREYESGGPVDISSTVTSLNIFQEVLDAIEELEVLSDE